MPHINVGVHIPKWSRMFPQLIESDFMKTLYLTGRYSDLTILCDGKEFAVHKDIVCTQSNCLRQLLEAQRRIDGQNIIELKYERACTIERMLAWLYTGNISLTAHYKDIGCCKLDRSTLGELVFYNALELFNVAESFELFELRTDAEEEILRWIAKCKDFITFSDAMSHLEKRVQLDDTDFRTRVARTAAERIHFFIDHNEDIDEELRTQPLMVQAFGIHAHEHSPKKGRPRKNGGTH